MALEIFQAPADDPSSRVQVELLPTNLFMGVIDFSDKQALSALTFAEDDDGTTVFYKSIVGRIDDQGELDIDMNPAELIKDKNKIDSIREGAKRSFVYEQPTGERIVLVARAIADEAIQHADLN